MVLKKIGAAILAAFLCPMAWCSNEWNDSHIGFVADVPEGTIMVYINLGCPLLNKIPIKARLQGEWHAAVFVGKDKVVQGCWSVYQKNGNVVFAWEDGQTGWMADNQFDGLFEA